MACPPTRSWRSASRSRSSDGRVAAPAANEYDDPMRVELLPSSLAAGSARQAPQFLSSYLVGDAVAIDAGSIGLLADLGRQRRVRHVFLTHCHLDHVASLPLLVENVHEPGGEGLEVLAHQTVLDGVRRDLFNDHLWPDFFRLSTPQTTFVRATPLEPMQTVERCGLEVTPVPVTHSTHTMGMVVDDGRSCVAFAADTGPTDLLWRHLAGRPNLRAVFLECSFPESLADLAAQVGHLCPSTFAAERARLPAGVRTIVVHRKAAHAGRIEAELAALAMPDVELVEPGRAYEL